MSRYLKSLAWLAAMTALAILAAVYALLPADRWRYEPDQPGKSDAIIVLAGDPLRPAYAADLYRRGYAPIVYLIRPAERSSPVEESVNRGILLANDVPERAIRVFSATARNTAAEASVSIAELPAEIKSILVVTSPDHVRRARIVFTDTFAGRGTRVAVVATVTDAQPGSWWSDPHSAGELAKSALYALGIHHLSWRGGPNR